MNIYFPPVQSNDFISHVFSKFADWIGDNTVIAGDFNYYFSSALDRSPPDALIVSLDAEKAFDQLEWPNLFSTLHNFGLGEGFIKRIQILHTSPLLAVITNGLRSSNFSIERGTRQVCPLSPLLFALAMEPLAAIIRQNDSLKGISLNNQQHQISLYVDDVLIYLDSPRQ